MTNPNKDGVPSVSPQPKAPYPGKHRSCWCCGADMGFIENRYYDARDTCGRLECQREAQDAWRDEEEESHNRVRDYYSGGGW